MKTERITVLASREFNAFLAGEAEAGGVSISELARQRCERQLGKDEALLGMFAEQPHLSNAAANVALDQALAALDIGLSLWRWRNPRERSRARPVCGLPAIRSTTSG